MLDLRVFGFAFSHPYNANICLYVHRTLYQPDHTLVVA